MPAPDEAGILGVYVDAKSTTGKVGKGTIPAVVYDAKTKRCPEPYTEFCYMRGIEQQANDVKSAELLFGLTCDSESHVSESRDSQSHVSQSIPGCMLLSRIWAARGQTDKARDLRRKACAAQPEMCWQMSTTNWFMDAATVVDLTPILCKLHNTYSGWRPSVPRIEESQSNWTLWPILRSGKSSVATSAARSSRYASGL